MGGRGSLEPADVSVAKRDAQMQMEHPGGGFGRWEGAFLWELLHLLSLHQVQSLRQHGLANQTNSETCQAEFKWICEREAIEM